MRVTSLMCGTGAVEGRESDRSITVQATAYQSRNATGSNNVEWGPAVTRLAPSGLGEGSRVGHDCEAVLQGPIAEVVDVGPKRGDMAAQHAIIDHQRPGSVVSTRSLGRMMRCSIWSAGM